MADEPENKSLVRFFLPRGLDAEAMAKAIQEIRRKAVQEAAEEKKAAERLGGDQGSKPNK